MVAPTVFVGTVQVYLVVLGTVFPPPSVGVILNVEPVQIVAACTVVTTGLGFTVIV